jgi:hypothetical protein
MEDLDLDVAPQVVVYGGPDPRPVLCITCGRKEPSQYCGCANGKKMIQCFKCLNDDYTWYCGCESDKEEKEMAVKAGLVDDFDALRKILPYTMATALADIKRYFPRKTENPVELSASVLPKTGTSAESAASAATVARSSAAAADLHL